MALAQSGYDVDTAADGVEAWAALHDVNYNLLVADQEMPRLGGLELAAQARLAGMRLPIVLASDSTDSLRDPADAWLNLAARLEKPFAVDSLIQTVEQTLRAANNLHQCSSTMISVLAHIANVQPYPHGGINE